MHREIARVGDDEIILETGEVARRADGAVVLRHHDTWILATVTAGAETDADFFPLTVDYREKRAAVGRIPGNYFRRETRPEPWETLTSRLIDRTLRPRFPKGFRRSVQIDITVYSADARSDLAGLALTAAGAAAHASPLPFAGPVAGARVVRVDERTTVLAPEPRDAADLDLLVGLSADGVVMVEGHGRPTADAVIVGALEAAVTQTAPLLDAAGRLAMATGGATPASAPPADEPSDEAAVDDILDAPDAYARRAALEARCAADPGRADALRAAFRAAVRARIIAGRRLDGRGPAEVRAIECRTGLLPGNHGSALFTRGGTQALVSATLGTGREGRDLDGLFGPRRKRFLLHYNFPGFAVGDPRGPRGPGRRELGHGELARRALLPLMPGGARWPYAVRVLSDITEADGSSSMATVCGATLALLDASVPLEAPVAGVAMGRVSDGARAVILTDISAEEDALGDMDLKVAGPADRVTAIQLDTKGDPLTTAELAEALTAAAAGRRHMLDAMTPAIDALATPRSGRRHACFDINRARVGHVIGSGGRNLNQLQGRTGTRIEVSKEGAVLILGPDHEAVAAARKAIEDIALELRAGGLYRAKVRNVREYGVFVRVADHEGLVHQSEWGEGDHRQASEGAQVLVRILGTDDRGRLVISRRAALGADPATALNA